MPDAMTMLETLRPLAWPVGLVAGLALIVWLVMEVRGLRRATRESAQSWARIARVQEDTETPSGGGLVDDRVALKAAAAVLLAMKRQQGGPTGDQPVDVDAVRAELADLLADWDDLDDQLERVVAAVQRDHADNS